MAVKNVVITLTWGTGPYVCPCVSAPNIIQSNYEKLHHKDSVKSSMILPNITIIYI